MFGKIKMFDRDISRPYYRGIAPISVGKSHQFARRVEVPRGTAIKSLWKSIELNRKPREGIGEALNQSYDI